MPDEINTLETAHILAPAKVNKRAGKLVGFHNQANLKAMARGQVLEALTANKGGKMGKRGLIFKIIESIQSDFDSEEAGIRREARADALKLAIAYTKDDPKTLGDLLSGASGANIQINFNSYFKDRQAEPSVGIDVARE